MSYSIMHFKMKNQFIIISVFLQTIFTVMSEDLFENSSNLCLERCLCNASQDNQTLSIDCVGRKMEHTIANWPEHSKNLIATFSNNTIVTLEKMPGSGAEDIKLVFSNCGIKYLQSGLFESTINVKYLDLSYNLLESEHLSSDVFKGPYNNSVYEPISLEHLDLAYNKIHSLQKKIFEHTPNLKYLNLEGNSLRIIDHVTCLALSKANQMQILNLANNRLTGVPSDGIKHFSNLTELNLSTNELDFVPIALGYVANSLQILNIDNNPIIEFEHDTFAGLQNILQLFSSNLNKLTQIHAKAFTPLTSLQFLMLSHNKNLKEIDEDAFGTHDGLQEIYLNDNALATLSPNLLRWSQFRVLDIANNEFLCNCDLFNISTQLASSVKSENVPLCLDPRSYISTDIYSLTNSTCSLKAERGTRMGSVRDYGNLRVLRITLSTLIIVLILAAAVAMWLGYSKWKTYKRSLYYPFPHSVIYTPIACEYPRF